MRRRGLSVVEVVIASSLVLLLLLCCEAAVRHMHVTSKRQQHQLDARKYTRAFLKQLRADLMASSYIFTRRNTTLLGQNLSLPAAGVSSSQLLFALPEEDGLDPNYTLALVFARPRSQVDSNNPDAREIVYHRFAPRTAVPAHIPGSLIDLPLTEGSTRVYDCYLPAGLDHFALQVAPNLRGVSARLHFRVAPARGPVVEERYETFVSLRNDG